MINISELYEAFLERPEIANFLYKLEDYSEDDNSYVYIFKREELERFAGNLIDYVHRESNNKQYP